MLKSFLIISAVVLGIVPAQAATMKAVYTGTVTSGYDYRGLFGLWDTALDGFEFKMTFIYDTLLGHRWSSPTYDRVAGGPDYEETTLPVLSAALELIGAGAFSTGGTESQISVWSDSPSLGRYQHVLFTFPTQGGDNSLNIFSMYNFWNAQLIPDLDKPVTLTSVADGHEYTGGFFLAADNCVEIENGYRCYAVAEASLKPDKLVITFYGDNNPAPVPLPATASLLAAAAVVLAAVAYSRRPVASS